MMAFSPLSGVLVARIGASRQMLIGTLISTCGMLLFLRGGVDASYIDILPALVVMGFGNSLIFAPMTTAVLNSVDTSKAGVASAVNGAVREVGAAFSIAFLGTIMNQAYQRSYNSSDAIEGLRADSALGPIQPLLDLVGSGVGLAGRVVQDPAVFPGFTAEVAAIVRDASSNAFMVGMDRGIIIGAMTMLIAAVLSYFLVDDRVVRGDAGSQAAELGEAGTLEGAPVEVLGAVQAGDQG
jgi:hypothetical protein